MEQDLRLRLLELQISPTTWEVGSFVLDTDRGKVMVAGVFEAESGMPRGFAPGPQVYPVGLVVAAMETPSAPATPGRPTALICESRDLAEALAPLAGLVDLRTGPTPAIAAFAAIDLDEPEPELVEVSPVPLTRLPEWHALAARVAADPPWAKFEQSLDCVFEGGALDGVICELRRDRPVGFSLYRDLEHQAAMRRTSLHDDLSDDVAMLSVTFATADLMDPDRLRVCEGVGLFVGGLATVVHRTAGLTPYPLTAEDESLLLDAVLAVMALVDGHAAELRSGDVVTTEVDVAGRTFGITAHRVDDEDAPGMMVPSLIPGEHWVQVGQAIDRETGEALRTVALQIARAEAGQTVQAVKEVDRLMALVDPSSVETVLIGFVGDDAVGVVARLPPVAAAELAGQQQVLLVIAAGGPERPAIVPRDVVHVRRVELHHR